MNGYGFALGIVSGMVAAVLQKAFLPGIPEYVSFTIATVTSLIGMIIGTYLGPPASDEVLFEFYKRTRPFGLWGAVRKRMDPEILAQIDRENRRDIISTFFAVPWQVVLFLTGMAVIVRRWDEFWWLSLILIGLSVALYFSWFRHLSTEVKVD